jgi:prevent-host-death family protein
MLSVSVATVTIHEAKTHFSKLIKRALAGEEIVVARGKEPLIRLEPLPLARGKRTAGGCAGVLKRMEEDFDEPLADFDAYTK